MREADRFRRLIVLVGPSGAGKDTVLRAWLAGLPPDEAPRLVQRTITRPADAGGEAHAAVDERRFNAMRAAGEFAFSWQAHGLHYGIPWRELQPLAEGRWVVMNGSREHLPQLLAVAPQAHVVEITASPEVRAQRLAQRGREHGPAVQERLSRQAELVAPHLTIRNDGALQQAVQQLDAAWRRWR